MRENSALEKGEVTPVLGWVKREHEGEVRAAFAKTVVVRRQGAQARSLPDRWLLGTLVRFHRAGEGEPCTGLKPAGTPIDPAPNPLARLGIGAESGILLGLTPSPLGALFGLAPPRFAAWGPLQAVPPMMILLDEGREWLTRNRMTRQP